MGMRIFITPPLLQAINTIAACGHGVELVAGDGGSYYSVTYLIVGIRDSRERAYTNKLRIKFWSHVDGQHYFQGVSQEFGDLRFNEWATVDELIKITKLQMNLNHWLEQYRSNPAWPAQLASV